MEDPAIEELQEAALAYAAVRDQRQKLTAREAELKQTLLTQMRYHKKQIYSCDGVEIERVSEEETVKVRVRKADPDDAGAPELAEDAAAEALCRLCEAPNPAFVTQDRKFFYCEKCEVNKQEGEVLVRILDTAKAEAIVEELLDGKSAGAGERVDPLEDEAQFINQRNRGRGRRVKP
jgi:hypothetical protein